MHQLINLLDAAAVNEAVPTLAQEATQRQSQNETDFCMDPSTEDIEAWDCDCYSSMQNRCHAVQATIGYTLGACIRTQFCNYPKVCTFWKDAHCNKPPIPALTAALRGDQELTMAMAATEVPMTMAIAMTMSTETGMNTAVTIAMAKATETETGASVTVTIGRCHVVMTAATTCRRSKAFGLAMKAATITSLSLNTAAISR